MHELKSTEISLFIEMIKSSIDSCVKKRPSKPREEAILKLAVTNRYQKRKHKHTESDNPDPQGTQTQHPMKSCKKSFYELYKEGVIKKCDQRKKNRSCMNATATKMPSIVNLSHTKIKSFQFNQHLPGRQVKYLRSLQSSPNRRERERRKQKQISTKLSSPKADSQCVAGTKKELSQRFQSRSSIIDQSVAQLQKLIQQPVTKLRLRRHRPRLMISETPKLIRHNPSTFPQKIQDFPNVNSISIDPWASNQEC